MHNVITKLTNNPSFPNIAATVAALQTALTDLQNAETAALTRAAGTVTVRQREARRRRHAAPADPGHSPCRRSGRRDPRNGGSIIESAGLAVKKVPTRAARAFTAEQGPVSGTATVTAVSAGPRTFFEWRYSPDGGKTWVNAPSSVRTKSVITGLPAGTTMQFRYRPVSKTGGRGLEPGRRSS